ncbi:hypothetical protein [Solicola gregarius]|uniref:Uncharacterized protein n=1 Tax=Solicola gregarius TaxID=2908642 RepID=A0AA46TJ64_9ACTN|nr:hypothetical protein [Solicola gregarius]UYM06286.1 hypothetical protein L0C25_04195 [Solicola gregarius]
MKNPYLLAAHLPEPLVHYGLRQPGFAPVTSRSSDFDETYADSQVAGLGLLTALLLEDGQQYSTHVANLGLDVRDQVLAFADVAPFVCRPQRIADFAHDPRESVDRAVQLLMCAVTAARRVGKVRVSAQRLAAESQAVHSLLDPVGVGDLLSAVQEIVTATCSHNHLDRFGDSIAHANTSFGP